MNFPKFPQIISNYVSLIADNEDQRQRTNAISSLKNQVEIQSFIENHIMKTASVVRLYDLQRRVLLLKRNGKRGGWCLPGGKTDQGETPIETAKREAQEEIGWTLHPEFLYKVGEYQTDIKGELGIVTVYDYTIVFNTLVQPVLSEEHCGYGWFQEEEIKRSMLTGKTQVALKMSRQT